MKTNALNDATDLFQIFDGEDKKFYAPVTENFQVKDSSWNEFPSELEPDNKYKFYSLHVSTNSDLLEINRKTTSFLDWMGEWGGLMDALHSISTVIISPYSAFALHSYLVSLGIVKVLPKTKNKKKDSKRKYLQTQNQELRQKDGMLKELLRNFGKATQIQPSNAVKAFFERCSNPKKYKIRMKAQALMDRELDLEKFIKRMRMQLTLALGLLTARQKIYVERTSRLLIHESSFPAAGKS